MRVLLIVISLLGAALVEWSLGWEVGGVTLPALAGMTFFWFFRLALYPRIFLGILLGLVLDSFHFFPFGTYLIVFCAEALLVELLLRLLVNAKSPPAQGLGLGITLLAFFFGAILVGSLLGKLAGETVAWGRGFLHISVGVFFWALFLSVFLASGVYIWQKRR
jgi:hypothetical protein